MEPKQLKWDEIPTLRNKLLKKQGGICPICKREIQNPALDHHHIRKIKGTGQIRGVLCRSCNVFLAKVENNCVRYAISREVLPCVLKNMAAYLVKKQEPYIHPSEAPRIPKLMKSSYNELCRNIKSKGKRIPEYPKSGRLTIPLGKLFDQYGLAPKFYP